MKLSFFMVLASVVVACSSSPPTSDRDVFGNLFHEPPPPVTSSRISSRLLLNQRITQKLDHFDSANTATWEMRYFSNSEHYVPGGPIFIYVGGEWEISYGWVTGGHIYDMAKELNGFVFYTEHRYYGKSYPTSDASTENLKYLDINQALADLAHFIDVQRQTLPGAKNAGVILVGASYSASMVAWFQQAYPGKANGAWASSAPLFAKTDFSEYKVVVSDTIKSVGPAGCADRIERAIAELEKDVEAGDMTRITTNFNPCTAFTSADQLDIWGFFSSLSNRFSGLVQYHTEGDIDKMCAAILDSNLKDDVEALAKYIRGSSTSCYNINYESTVKYYKDASWQAESTMGGSRQWYYQTCNEFGWYQTSSAESHIFGSKFPVDLYARMCADFFDGSFDLAKIQSNVLATNNRHNGFVPQLTNVFFTHGEYDPWRPMGVQEPLNENTPTVILRGYAHCQDLYSISSTDSEQMVNTKKDVLSYVRRWLGF